MGVGSVEGCSGGVGFRWRDRCSGEVVFRWADVFSGGSVGGGGGSGSGGGGNALQSFRITYLINAEFLAKFCTTRET